jgi:hypothetical protein
LGDFRLNNQKVDKDSYGEDYISEEEIVKEAQANAIDLTNTFGIFFHFYMEKVTNKEGNKIPDRKKSDVESFFTFDAKDSEKYDFIGNTDVKSLLTDYATKECSGIASIYNWNVVYLQSKYGQSYPKGSNLNLFSNIEEIAKKYNMEVEEMDTAFIRVIKDKKSANRTISCVKIYNNVFEIVLAASIEDRKAKKDGEDPTFLPQVEAILLQTGKVKDFETESKVFDDIVNDLNNDFNNARSKDNFSDIYKEIDEKGEYTLTIKAKEKPTKKEEEVKEEGKEKKSRKKKKEDEAAKMVADASAKMVKDAKAKEEVAETPKDDLNIEEIN